MMDMGTSTPSRFRLSGLWGVADPAVGVEREPEQVEGQEAPPVRAAHFGGSQRRGRLL